MKNDPQERRTLSSRLDLLRRRDFAWLLAGLLSAGIALLSLTPRPEQILHVRIWDKLGHFSAYGTLALAFAHALCRSGQRGLPLALIAILGSSAYGGAIEILQGFFPPRTPDVMDALANAIGACLGAATFFAVSRGWALIRPAEARRAN